MKVLNFDPKGTSAAQAHPRPRSLPAHEQVVVFRFCFAFMWQALFKHHHHLTSAVRHAKSDGKGYIPATTGGYRHFHCYVDRPIGRMSGISLCIPLQFRLGNVSLSQCSHGGAYTSKIGTHKNLGLQTNWSRMVDRVEKKNLSAPPYLRA